MKNTLKVQKAVDIVFKRLNEMSVEEFQKELINRDKYIDEDRYLFLTPTDLQMQLFKIGAKMRNSGLDDGFVAKATSLGLSYRGIYDLFILWENETSQDEKK